jgi:hypothetical protein
MTTEQNLILRVINAEKNMPIPEIPFEEFIKISSAHEEWAKAFEEMRVYANENLYDNKNI